MLPPAIRDERLNIEVEIFKERGTQVPLLSQLKQSIN